ncbi:MFS transporter [Bordetella sp. N]|uniref:MFS transporter n=1 Tax=Bordetella sp. N TaxID=1746199 RepID=UPI0007095F16|nr:MFS transporter [Bordetella sp. N]ALM82198.1 multidrug MFS transporter [Bordetella sp. N]
MKTIPDKSDSGAILLVASGISSLVTLDSNVVAVALPTIARSLSAGFADLQWVITAYVLPFAALLLAAGSFADMVGRRRAVILGQLIFAAASLGCGLATSALMLNVSRAFQGVGASLLLTASLAVINHSFKGLARARAFGVWGASLGIAMTSGPILGGVISSTVGWQWAFLINLPICALLIVGTLKVIPESKDPLAKRLDVAGILLFSTGLFSLIWAVIDGNTAGWLSPPVIGRAAAGVVLLGAFVVAERIQARPMVDFLAMKSRAFGGSASATVGYATSAQVMIFYLPLYLQNTCGFTPAEAGLGMLPFAVPMFVVPRFTAKYLHRTTPRRMLTCGLAVSATANLAIAALASVGAGYIAFSGAMTLAGVGAGVLNGETAKSLQGSLPAHRSGMASGLSGTVRFTSLLFGVAALGAVLVATTTRYFLQQGVAQALGPEVAVHAAKRFAAGDIDGTAREFPPALSEAAIRVMHDAFDKGFALTACTAAILALLSLSCTWVFLRKVESDELSDSVQPVLHGE